MSDVLFIVFSALTRRCGGGGGNKAMQRMGIVMTDWIFDAGSLNFDLQGLSSPHLDGGQGFPWARPDGVPGNGVWGGDFWLIRGDDNQNEITVIASRLHGGNDGRHPMCDSWYEQEHSYRNQAAIELGLVGVFTALSAMYPPAAPAWLVMAGFSAFLSYLSDARADEMNDLQQANDCEVVPPPPAPGV